MQQAEALNALRVIFNPGGTEKAKAKAKAKGPVDITKLSIEDLRKTVKLTDKSLLPSTYRYLGSYSADDLRVAVNYIEPLLSLQVLRRGRFTDHWVCFFFKLLFSVMCLIESDSHTVTGRF